MGLENVGASVGRLLSDKKLTSGMYKALTDLQKGVNDQKEKNRKKIDELRSN